MRRLFANILDLGMFGLILFVYLEIIGKNITWILIDYSTYISFLGIGIGYYVIIPLFGLCQTFGYQFTNLYLKDFRYLNPRDIKAFNFLTRQLFNFWALPITYLIHLFNINSQNQVITTLTFTLMVIMIFWIITNFLTYIAVTIKLIDQTLIDQIQGIKVTLVNSKKGGKR